jgi:hypothetical protein
MPGVATHAVFWPFVEGLAGDRVDVHRRRAATKSLKAEVVEREASEVPKPLDCVARDEELALEVSRRLLDA